MIKLLALLLLLAPAANAQRRTVMENLAASNNTIFVATPTARVGVGTTTPVVALDVAGAGRFSSGVIVASMTMTGVGGNAFIGTGDGELTAASANVILRLNRTGSNAVDFRFRTLADEGNFLTAGADPITFSPNASEAMRVASGGNVGVGTTSPDATLDVNGSAQFGSGATKSTFTATPGAGTYALQLSSGMTLPQGATGVGIRWADGTTSTTAVTASAAASTVFQTSITVNNAAATTNTTFTTCYATGTLTFSGGKAVVWYNGGTRNSGGVSTFCTLNVLLDGSYISPWTSTQGMSMGINTGSNTDHAHTLLRVFDAPSNGSHAYCLAMAVSANTCTFSNVSFVGNQFGVMELK